MTPTTNSPEQKTRIAIVALTVLAFGGALVNSVLARSRRGRLTRWTSIAPAAGDRR
jgi:hypothetical protein